MKYIDYMKDHPTENLCWCKPYIANDGKYALILQEGMVNSLHTPEGDFYVGDNLTDEVLEKFARTVNQDYDFYSGWSDLHIALEAMQTVGCHDCPFKDVCMAMNEEVEDW